MRKLLMAQKLFESNQSVLQFNIWTVKNVLKMGQSRALFVYFRSFHIPIQMTNKQFEQNKLKKHWCCAWDSNPGRQDRRRRQIHWAIVAPRINGTCWHSVMSIFKFTKFQFLINYTYSKYWRCELSILVDCTVNTSWLSVLSFQVDCTLFSIRLYSIFK